MGRPALAALSLLRDDRRRARRRTERRQPDTERYTLRAEVGLEYDTNAHRTEIVAGGDNPPLVASPLERLVLAGTLSDVVADGQLLTLGATVAGKIFDAPAAADEDVAIAQSSLAWAKALGPRATLTLAGAYYEAFQAAGAEPARRSRAARLSLAGADGAARLDPAAERLDLSLVSAGYRNVRLQARPRRRLQRRRPPPPSCAGAARPTTTPTGRRAPAPPTSTAASADRR